MCHIPSTSFFFLLCLSIALSIQAQNLEQLRPTNTGSELPTGPDPAMETASAAAPGARETLILPELHGIMLQPSPEAVVLEGVRTEGVTDRTEGAPPAVVEAAGTFLGQPLTLGQLQEIQIALERAYAEHQEVLVRISIPEQDVTDGVIQLVVTEAQLGEVNVANASHMSEDRYRDHVRTRLGAPFASEIMTADVTWLDRHPFRQAAVVYRPGDAFGEIDVELRLDEERPWSVFAGYDNDGTPLLGENRLNFGFTLWDPWVTDAAFTYQFLSDVEFDHLQAHFLHLMVPLPWRHEWSISGYHADSRANGIGGNGLFNQEGTSDQVSTDYRIPLPRLGPIRHDLALGFDYKDSNSNLEFGGNQVFGTPTQIFQFRLGYEGAATDPLGETAWQSWLVLSPGGWTRDNSDAVFQAARFGASADYVYARLALDRSWNLPYGVTLDTGLTAQVASSNLLASEQLILSGITAVRGFENYAARGDHGIVLRTQLNSPALSLLGLAGRSGAEDRWVFYSFFDYGWGGSVDPLPGEPDISLGSLGIGLTGAWSDHLTWDLGYGWQVIRHGFQDGEPGRFYGSITATF